MPSPDSEKRQKVQSILVIHQGALGDFILALPSLKVLRRVTRGQVGDHGLPEDPRTGRQTILCR